MVNRFWIAVFHARAATSPKATVINSANLSRTSAVTFSSFSLAAPYLRSRRAVTSNGPPAIPRPSRYPRLSSSYHIAGEGRYPWEVFTRGPLGGEAELLLSPIHRAAPGLRPVRCLQNDPGKSSRFVCHAHPQGPSSTRALRRALLSAPCSGLGSPLIVSHPPLAHTGAP